MNEARRNEQLLVREGREVTLESVGERGLRQVAKCAIKITGCY